MKYDYIEYDKFIDMNKTFSDIKYLYNLRCGILNINNIKCFKEVRNIEEKLSKELYKYLYGFASEIVDINLSSENLISYNFNFLYDEPIILNKSIFDKYYCELQFILSMIDITPRLSDLDSFRKYKGGGYWNKLNCFHDFLIFSWLFIIASALDVIENKNIEDRLNSYFGTLSKANIFFNTKIDEEDITQTNLTLKQIKNYAFWYKFKTKGHVNFRKRV